MLFNFKNDNLFQQINFSELEMLGLKISKIYILSQNGSFPLIVNTPNQSVFQCLFMKVQTVQHCSKHKTFDISVLFFDV